MLINLISDYRLIMGKWSKEEWTSLPVRKITHKELTALGRKNENYDDIIRRLCGLDPIEKEEKE